MQTGGCSVIRVEPEPFTELAKNRISALEFLQFFPVGKSGPHYGVNLEFRFQTYGRIVECLADPDQQITFDSLKQGFLYWISQSDPDGLALNDNRSTQYHVFCYLKLSGFGEILPGFSNGRRCCWFG